MNLPKPSISHRRPVYLGNSPSRRYNSANLMKSYEETKADDDKNITTARREASQKVQEIFDIFGRSKRTDNASATTLSSR